MSSVRRVILRAAFACAAACLGVAGASATTFDATYSIDAIWSSTSGGVGLAEANVVSNPVFTLTTAGETHLESPLFRIYSLENCCSNSGTDDDGTARPIQVSFAFAAPPGGAGLPITGTTQGHIVTGPDYISISWDNETLFTFANGAKLSIALSDATLSCSSSNNNCAPKTVKVKDDPSCREEDDSGREGGGGCTYHNVTTYASTNVNATFKLVTIENPPVSEVPLPASLPMLVAGMGALGLIARQRNRKRAS